MITSSHSEQLDSDRSGDRTSKHRSTLTIPLRHPTIAKKVDKKRALTRLDVVKSHFNVLVSIRSRLFVYYPERMHHFVLYGADSFTPISKVNILRSALSPYR